MQSADRQKTRRAVYLAGGGLAVLLGALLTRHFISADQPPTQPADAPAVGSEQRAWFEDEAQSRGLRFQHTRGARGDFLFPEIVTGGAGLFDYDNDGALDVYFVQGGSLYPDTPDRAGNQLFRNRGDGTFEEVTEAAGVGDRGYGMGCACGDYDGDGDTDLYVSNYGPNVLYRNNGDGTFSDVTATAGVGDGAWSCSTAFTDINGDGHLDLFVVNYLTWSRDIELACFAGTSRRDYCKPNNYNSPARDTLYRNNGDGSFTDISASSGIHTAFGNGLGIALSDFNGDGVGDVYVANDGMPNQLWINDGTGRFTDEALPAGCAVNVNGTAEAGMGVAAVDADNDGDADLFMTHLHEETHTFYLNRGAWFDDATAQTGLSGPSLSFTGFGMGFADFDQDGRRDLFVCNGRVGIWEPFLEPADPYAEPNQLFQGLDALRFEEVMPRGGTPDNLLGTGRGAAFGDIDNDGDVDVVVINSGGPARLLINHAADSGGRSVQFRVVHSDGHTLARGTRVRIRIGERNQWRTVDPAYSFCASNDPRLHFGVGSANRIDLVLVRWPDGREERFGSIDAGAMYELREGTGHAVRIRPF